MNAAQLVGLFVATAAATPVSWTPYITAITGLVVALGTLVGTVIALIKVFQNKEATVAEKHRVDTLSNVATVHEGRLDELSRTQAQLENITGPVHADPAT